MKQTLALLLLFFVPLFAEEDIIVHLSSDGQLAPLYLDSFQGEQAGLSTTYLNSLESILRFDLDHNSKTQVVAKASEYIAQTKKEKGWKVFEKGPWDSFRLSYVVKVSVSNKSLSAACYTVEKGSFRSLEGITLTGNLNDDRKKMHEVADAIFQALFNKKGIANSKILYTVRKKAGSNSAEWQTDVWEADYDGNNARQITHDNFLCVTPTYIGRSAAARHFLYVSYKIGQPKIMMASTKDGAGKRLTFMRGNQLMPVLSPKKDCLAFVSDITGNPELFVQPFSMEKGLLDKPRQVFSAKGGAQASPSFSSDGRRLAFVSNKDGSPRIYMIDIPAPGLNPASVKATLISKQNKDNTCPAWSPDGTKLAYSSSTKGVRQIWIYDFKAKREYQLTKGSGHKENPAWAPDSEHLVYNTSTGNSAEIFMVNLHQKEAVQISSGPGEKRFPAWEL